MNLYYKIKNYFKEINLFKTNINMSYSLDSKRKTPWMVIDMTTEEGMEGVYAGTYDDCQQYMAEQAKHSSCIGMDIVPNPYYKNI